VKLPVAGPAGAAGGVIGETGGGVGVGGGSGCPKSSVKSPAGSDCTDAGWDGGCCNPGPVRMTTVV
jgi:hypothetical protein